MAFDKPTLIFLGRQLRHAKVLELRACDFVIDDKGRRWDFAFSVLSVALFSRSSKGFCGVETSIPTVKLQS
jgi:hypothetical protein